MSKISGTMIVLNEEKYIKRCLSDIIPHVDEMIVVDGGSTDATVDICTEMGVSVFHRKFENNFGEQKSYAVSLASYPWVFLIDADEVCEPRLWSTLPRLSEQSRYDIIGFSRKNIYADGLDIDPADLANKERWHNWPDVQYRFFRNYVRYSGELHESPMRWKNAAHFEDVSIIHHKTWKRQKREDDLYFQIRPNDYPDRLEQEGHPNHHEKET